MKKLLFRLSLVLLLYPAFSKGQGNQCDSAEWFCPVQSTSYPARVNGGTAQPGPSYGCLLTRPNPSWWYMNIHDSGTVFITVHSSPAHDIDFICWGPFSSVDTACDGGLTTDKIIACDYGTSSILVDTIPNGIPGEYYILLITNYSNLPCTVTLSQTGGTGTLYCDTITQEISEPENKTLSLRNYPNPFSNKTIIVFTVPHTTNSKLDIYDITGRHIQTLFYGVTIKDKEYSIEYDCKDNTLGILFYMLTTDENLIIGKMMHLNSFSVPY